MRAVAILNQKGGVGKTTTAVNLGAALASRGRRVLLIDMDPQGNLSDHLGVDPEEGRPGTYEVLVDRVASLRRLPVKKDRRDEIPLAGGSADAAHTFGLAKHDLRACL